MKLQYLFIAFLTLALYSCGGEEKEESGEENSDTVETPQDTTSTVEVTPPEGPYKKISFPSLDSLEITAELYEVQLDSVLPYMLLCHQARWSRGEYRETAPMFNKLGFHCMAIDQRSGGEVNGVANETFARAVEAGLSTQYIDAEADIVAALNFLYDRAGQQPVILLGSSYSSALVLKVASEHQDKVKAVISFSPGEYYKDYSVAGWCNGFNVPFWVTSSKEEAPAVTELIKGNKSANKVQFIPEMEGDHGARALWEEKEAHEEYWASLKAFLSSI